MLVVLEAIQSVVGLGACCSDEMVEAETKQGVLSGKQIYTSCQPLSGWNFLPILGSS